ncbi:MAG: ABC transporter permease, partial [Pseudomonadota bacterium]
MSLLFIAEIIVALALIAALAWSASQNNWRDARLGNYIGFAIAGGTVLFVVYYYFKTKYAPTDPNLPEGNFFRWALQGLVIFGIAGTVFKELGKRIGTEGTKKAFRTMPVTASFGILVILIYATVAIFAGVIAPYGEGE